MTGSALTQVERDKFIAGGEKDAIRPCVMTKEETDKLQQAQGYLLWNLPFFADLLLGRLGLVPTKQVPIAATDGFAVYIRPDTFFAYKTKEQVFILAHEVMHCVFNDTGLMHVWKKTGKVQCPGGVYDYDPDLMNQAADYVINAMLIHAQVGQFNKDWLYDENLSKKGEESAVVVYEKLIKNPPPPPPPPPGGGGQCPPGQPGNSPGNQPPSNPGNQPGNSPSNQPVKPPVAKGPGGTPRQFDKHLSPGRGQGMNPDKAVEKRSAGEWRVAVAAAAQSAKAQGKMPAGLERFIGEILEPKVSWQERIRSAIVRRIGNDGYDFTNLDEVFLNRESVGYEQICFPAPTAFGCGTLVVGVDTSGSIGEEELTRFFSEMGGIVSDLNPRELYVMWCDAKVHRVDQMEEPEDLVALKADVDKKGAGGGGGTSFVPVFKKIAKMGLEPDAVVYLTDMYGDFPEKAPSYPVIWGSISEEENAPFGDVVKVDL